jgi:uncharacterized membrane protein
MPPDRPLVEARRWILGTMALLAACVCTAVLRTSTWPQSAGLAAVLLIPLLLPLRGLLRGDRRTHAWATLCVGPYIVYGITESVANPAVRGLAALVLLTSLAHFVALVAYLRLSRPSTSAQAGPTP